MEKFSQGKFGLSIGTDLLLESLSDGKPASDKVDSNVFADRLKQIKKNESPFLFNVRTLTENIIQAFEGVDILDLPLESVLFTLYQEMEFLEKELEHILNYKKEVLFFLLDESYILKMYGEHRKNESSSKINVFYKNLIKYIEEELKQRKLILNIDRFSTLIDKHGLCLISRELFPMTLIVRHDKFLLESHTGGILSTRELDKKFKLKFPAPFNYFTYGVYGDINLKRLSRKEVMAFNELCSSSLDQTSTLERIRFKLDSIKDKDIKSTLVDIFETPKKHLGVKFLESNLFVSY